MGSRQTLLIFVLAIFIVGLAACSSNSDEPDSAATTTVNPTSQPNQPDSPADSTSEAANTPSNTPTDPPGDDPPAGIAAGERSPGFSPEKLPLQKITFAITTPLNTPTDEPIYLAIVDITGTTDQHVEMKNLGGGAYEAIAEVQSGAMIRYTYDRHDGTNCCDSDVTREALGDRFSMQYRFLLAENDLQRVNDTVGTWNDLRAPHIEGTISGRITDRITGAPIFDADVSISGIHVGTRVDGSYKIEGLPPGEHTVIAYSDTGDFLPAQSVVVIIGNHSEIKDLTVVQAKLVPVTFEVVLPDSTPENAWVKIGGNIRSLAARIGHPSRPLTPDNYFLPLLEREGNTAFGDFMLPEGAVIEYFYTIGPIGVANERGALGGTMIRSFVVGPDSGNHRSDRVKFWNNEGWPLVTLQLIPPANTPKDAKIALNMGPSSWMERREDGTYTTVLGTGPAGSTMSYRYLLGDDFHGVDASDAADDGLRTFTVQDGIGVVTDTVTRWLGQPDPSKRREDGSLAVTFRVSVPLETPVDAEIYLIGDRAAVLSSIEMIPLANNPWIYEAEVVFAHDGPLHYSFELRSEGGLESFANLVDTNFDGR